VQGRTGGKGRVQGWSWGAWGLQGRTCHLPRVEGVTKSGGGVEVEVLTMGASYLMKALVRGARKDRGAREERASSWTRVSREARMSVGARMTVRVRVSRGARVSRVRSSTIPRLRGPESNWTPILPPGVRWALQTAPGRTVLRG